MEKEVTMTNTCSTLTCKQRDSAGWQPGRRKKLCPAAFKHGKAERLGYSLKKKKDFTDFTVQDGRLISPVDFLLSGGYLVTLVTSDYPPGQGSGYQDSVEVWHKNTKIH